MTDWCDSSVASLLLLTSAYRHLITANRTSSTHWDTYDALIPYTGAQYETVQRERQQQATVHGTENVVCYANSTA